VTATYTFTSGNSVKIYVNGSLAEEIAGQASGNPDPNELDEPLVFGGMDYEGDAHLESEFEGAMDEVRISKIARDLCWIETEYNNQDNSGPFYIVGDEESAAGAAVLTQQHFRWRNDEGTELEFADWWNTNYPYRRKVTFGTSHSTLLSGYTVSASMDTQSATTNVALASGDDVRVVWQEDGESPVELDRIGDTWDNAATTIQFRLQSEISADADEDADGSYYIYYGYASAGSPPADEEDVYYFFDDFNRADSATVDNGWTETESSPSITKIASNRLDFDSQDAQLWFPQIQHALTGTIDSGILKWT